ncbi:MAG: hypothetical protein BWK80_21665 [Desulfobacteraceae bacterium IS3]|nr:MAG: hypothetical protein BWK80_21665 [Desulfobacteraceae bacterium IS3]
MKYLRIIIIAVVFNGFSPLILANPVHQAHPVKTEIKPGLAQRLGFSQTDKILIINGDDVAVSRSANAAAIIAMEQGLMTSGTIMVPSSWFPQIAAYAKLNPKADFGIHITLTSEWEFYRWDPISDKIEVPNLTDAQGYLWSSVELFRQNAPPEEAEIEAKAQIEMAYAAGIDITHLDSHMWTMMIDSNYYEVYLKLAKEFDLPVRMPTQASLESKGLGTLREKMAADGILCPDFLFFAGRRQDESLKDCWKRLLNSLQPGVTEIYIHAALPTAEMQAMTGENEAINWRVRAMEYELFTHDPDIRALIQSHGVKLIGYRALRELQRRERAAFKR